MVLKQTESNPLPVHSTFISNNCKWKKKQNKKNHSIYTYLKVLNNYCVNSLLLRVYCQVHSKTWNITYHKTLYISAISISSCGGNSFLLQQLWLKSTNCSWTWYKCCQEPSEAHCHIKTSRKQSCYHNLHPKWPHHELNNNRNYY